MEWKHDRVLVTGGGGFIGSHLVERLVQLGARTRAMVRYNSTGRQGWLDHSSVRNDIEIVSGDIRDSESVRKAVRGSDVVFHLAALIGIPYSYHTPRSYIQTNVEGTYNLLQASLEEGVRTVVHTSTSEVYGTAQQIPITEAHPLQGQSPYSASKIGADKLAEAYHLSFQLPVAIIRPFNTYGPRQSARAVIPTIITQASMGVAVRLGSLAPKRDFTYVTDTVDGFIRVAETPAAVGQVINVGTGREVAIGQLAEVIFSLMGKNPQLVQESGRIRPETSEVDRLLADSRKAWELLGWGPQHSLESGLALTIEWIENNMELLRVGSYAI